MSIRLSQAVANSVAHGLGWGEIIRGGTCVVYSGTQPTTAELAATAGTELCRFTLSKGALTSEVRAACKVEVSADAGNVSSIKVGGVELLNTTVTTGTNASTNASLIVAAINANATNPDYYATLGGTIGSGTAYASGAGIFYILAPKNSGTFYNGATLVPVSGTGSTTTLKFNNGTASASAGTNATYFADATLTGSVVGVAMANGLVMSCPAVAGLITASGTWQGTASATGTAGWFRILCTPQFDTGLINLATTGDAAYLVMRIDGTVGTSGADMLVSSTSITSGVDQTLTSFSLTVPTL
jgi:hypothetical protein